MSTVVLLGDTVGFPSKLTMSLPFSQLEEGVQSTGEQELLSKDEEVGEEAKTIASKAQSERAISICCSVNSDDILGFGYDVLPIIPEGPVLFSEEQRTILIRYFNEYGMTSTHRRNTELMAKCAEEVGTTIERVKVSLLTYFGIHWSE